MKLAKPHVDVGLVVRQLEPMLAFWQGEAGCPFEELLPTGRGNHQHRHAMNGSVLKLNASRDPVPETPPTGYRELWIARPGSCAVMSSADERNEWACCSACSTPGIHRSSSSRRGTRTRA